MKYLSKLIIALLLTAGITTAGCSDLLNPSTPQSKPIESVQNVDDLSGLMNGAYSRLGQTPLYGRDYVVLGDVRTGNAWSNGYSGRFVNSSMLQVTPQASLGIWDAAYEVISNTNIIINSDVEGEGVGQIKGQAYAVRALSHMMLLKMYGQQSVDGSDLGIPYVTTFGERENFFPSRPTIDQTLAKIEADYLRAIDLLDPSVTGPKPTMTYYAAQALLSRFYLFAGNYQGASEAAKEVIDSGVYSLVPASEYVAAWASDGEPSVIFEIDMNTTDSRGSNSIFQILRGEAYGDVEVTEELFNLFGPNDVRNDLYGTEVTSADGASARVNYRVVAKFQDQYKNTPVIRYAEVILNYAEAQARLGNLVEALTYLNMIPSNRNATTYTAVTQAALVDNILLERRKELAMEGLYYWQLMRTGQGITRTGMRQDVSSNEVTVPYGNPRLAYPIPIQEMDANPNMQQNAGYGG
ncbi:MAG TPA: RagB/SusD family nutrient uptake outer membrane protein [Balneolaceae bacterium]